MSSELCCSPLHKTTNDAKHRCLVQSVHVIHLRFQAAFVSHLTEHVEVFVARVMQSWFDLMDAWVSQNKQQNKILTIKKAMRRTLASATASFSPSPCGWLKYRLSLMVHTWPTTHNNSSTKEDTPGKQKMQTPTHTQTWRHSAVGRLTQSPRTTASKVNKVTAAAQHSHRLNSRAGRTVVVKHNIDCLVADDTEDVLPCQWREGRKGGREGGREDRIKGGDKDEQQRDNTIRVN